MKRGYTLRKINWVIPGGRSKRMFLMLGCVSWILMLLCSCGRNLPDSEQVIKRYLKEKYNQEFQIVHTERKNIGQNFGEFINTGEAVSLNESDDAFSFTIYEDGRITDNYPKVILGNQIKQDIYSILDHGKLEYTNVDIRFIESDQEYVTFEDYKSNHNVLIFSDLKGLETNVDKNIENAYDLLCALRDQGYYFCLTIDIDKASKTIIYDQDNEMISKEVQLTGMYARWIVMPKNSNSGSDLATYIASNAELLTEQNYTDIDALVFAEIIHRGFYG